MDKHAEFNMLRICKYIINIKKLFSLSQITENISVFKESLVIKRHMFDYQQNACDDVGFVCEETNCINKI